MDIDELIGHLPFQLFYWQLFAAGKKTVGKITIPLPLFSQFGMPNYIH